MRSPIVSPEQTVRELFLNAAWKQSRSRNRSSRPSSCSMSRVQEEPPMPPPSDSGKAGRYPRSTVRSEEHTSELQSLMRISYAVFCLKKKNKTKHYIYTVKQL